MSLTNFHCSTSLHDKYPDKSFGFSIFFLFLANINKHKCSWFIFKCYRNIKKNRHLNLGKIFMLFSIPIIFLCFSPVSVLVFVVIITSNHSSAQQCNYKCMLLDAMVNLIYLFSMLWMPNIGVDTIKCWKCKVIVIYQNRGNG